jgi:hypothetical protein
VGRKFITENIATKERTEYILNHGDVFYFDKEFDLKHKHSIPKQKVNGERISVVIFADDKTKQVKSIPDILHGGTLLSTNMNPFQLQRFLEMINK